MSLKASLLETVTRRGVVDTLLALGNIGALPIDDQILRVDTILGKSAITQEVNFQELAKQTNLSYGVLMLMFRVSIATLQDTAAYLYFNASSQSFSNEEAAHKALKQKEPMKIDMPEKEIKYTNMDLSESSSSMPSTDNYKNPIKKKSRKSKKQKKQPEDTTPALKGKERREKDYPWRS
ncbi:hypothetical protein RclHR1_07560003 [Rhizophagus clarus]|uniref:Uncharacterized protein n=1 Tax=Rhizophagus clarus TaxID=94130 RepID=A0A2Z6SLP9_9GLOM|nr:hypothetical protein RclHR1_07560003 [Rhizophagus clarus]GES97858.1 hypothetical protein RCL_jg3625.t1 [Rhizophagus clarus]